MKKSLSLYEELIQKGQKQGIEKGIELGAEKKSIQTIINCFDNGLTLDQTRLISGETVEKIKEVLKANNRKF